MLLVSLLAIGVVVGHHKVVLAKAVKGIVILHVGRLVLNIVLMIAKEIALRHVHPHVIEDFVQADVVVVVHIRVLVLVIVHVIQHVIAGVIQLVMVLVLEHVTPLVLDHVLIL